MLMNSPFQSITWKDRALLSGEGAVAAYGHVPPLANNSQYTCMVDRPPTHTHTKMKTKKMHEAPIYFSVSTVPIDS